MNSNIHLFLLLHVMIMEQADVKKFPVAEGVYGFQIHRL
jgi:hypothetical protein